MDDHELAAEAIIEMMKCNPKPGKPRPKVGAVVVRDGVIIARAHRDSAHAEFRALGDSLDVRGATVYTTLEPCIRRSKKKTPCSHHLVDRGIRRVVIGQLDPNPEIQGRGIAVLAQHRVAVDFFPDDLLKKVNTCNAAFADAFKVEGQDPLERYSSRSLAHVTLLTLAVLRYAYSFHKDAKARKVETWPHAAICLWAYRLLVADELIVDPSEIQRQLFGTGNDILEVVPQWEEEVRELAAEHGLEQSPSEPLNSAMRCFVQALAFNWTDQVEFPNMPHPMVSFPLPTWYPFDETRHGVNARVA